MRASSTSPKLKKVKRSVPESGWKGQTKPSSSVGHTSAANSENPEEKGELVIDEHLAANHSSRVNCEFCGGTYGNERSLSVHVTRSHWCRHCGWSIYYYEREEHFNAQCRKCGVECECVLLMDQHVC
ncbi:Hypothetical predicted protein [Cloeon dipterum]|uniref:C2H2-type domain-containing protein n=1 Tax=Cloeon dipterum TaxID=197152 RepID=A0A8S1D6Z6_9INSE|nr:Hypothetical predicted protein [Cloeon dipterum]